MSRLVSFEGALLWNRLLWMGVAAAIMAFAYVRFKFVFALEGRRAPQKEMAASEVVALRIPTVTREFSTAAFTRALVRLTRLGFTETVKNIYFAVIVLAGIMFMIAALAQHRRYVRHPDLSCDVSDVRAGGRIFGLFTPDHHHVLFGRTGLARARRADERADRRSAAAQLGPVPLEIVRAGPGNGPVERRSDAHRHGDPARQRLYASGAAAVHQRSYSDFA